MKPSRSPASIPIKVIANHLAERFREPLTCGIPWPRGALRDKDGLILEDGKEKPVPVQTRVLDRWSDGSIRWLLVDWQASVSGPTGFLLKKREKNEPLPLVSGIRTRASRCGLDIDTGAARFTLQSGFSSPFASAVVNGRGAIDASHTLFSAEDAEGSSLDIRFERIRVEEAGHLRTTVLCGGRLRGAGPGLNVIVRLHFYKNSPAVRFDVTLHNPNRQRHRGGIWQLGDEGSFFLKDFAFRLALPQGCKKKGIRWSEYSGADYKACLGRFTLYQDSSGGNNWQSKAHVNRDGWVPNRFRGYRVTTSEGVREGLRATPVVSLSGDGRRLTLAVEHFWQNFPKAIEVEERFLTYRLFPWQYADVHEVQGGEQKTHRFFVAFGEDQVTSTPLIWCLDPLLAYAPPEWYCESGVIPELLPRAADPNVDYVALIDHAVDSSRSFFAKREVVDEYGWRNFGDLYADHEADFHQGPEPLVSHYNNQYDALYAFLVHFMRSGDARWMKLGCDLATHTSDIDVYHTEKDRAAYNQGLHWHTDHYKDAGTSSHRGFMTGSMGGGPAAEHCYNEGLMLHYFLAGDELSKEVAIRLGRWIVNMEDGRKTIFGVFDRGDTGRASLSGSEHYHGPGRGAGNAIMALMTAHRLSGDPHLWAWVEKLIRRCVHPDDDLDARDLGNVEPRWFYTIFFQTLGAYLDEKIERDELDYMYAYARASLLHYARWMADHEYVYLEKPEILEFPNDSWSAQEMRKSEVFKYAAKHSKGALRARFLERADYFFDRSVQALTAAEKRTYTRVMVILARHGYRHGYYKAHPELRAPEPPREDYDFGSPAPFVMQKHRVLGRFGNLIKLLKRGRCLGQK